MASEEPFSKSNEQYFREANKDYEIESFDRKSLDEIRRLIREKLYKNPQQLRDHMEFVENLIQRLSQIISDEEKAGIQNFSLKRDFGRIKDLYVNMSAILDELEGA